MITYCTISNKFLCAQPAIINGQRTTLKEYGDTRREAAHKMLMRLVDQAPYMETQAAVSMIEAVEVA